MTFDGSGEKGHELSAPVDSSLPHITQTQRNMLSIISADADKEGWYPPLEDGSTVSVSHPLAETMRVRFPAKPHRRPITRTTVAQNIKLLVNYGILDVMHNNPGMPKARTNLKVKEIGKKLLDIE